MTDTIKDASKTHWVYRAPLELRPYLQLARYDRPVGYWLLALPGWIGLAFASMSHGFAQNDLKWAALILVGAIAMRGAGCTYNDIVDRDLDAQVDRTALRPIPAGTVSVKQAWLWLMAQCFVGLLVLLCLPSLAQVISLCSIPLVAAYPFMKRITWWPQVWLGLTFNWAVLVAYAAKTEAVSPAVLVLYAGLIFWTIGYDTIYACQDIEDDMKIGVKSTARRFGTRVKLGVGFSYLVCTLLIGLAVILNGTFVRYPCGDFIAGHNLWNGFDLLNIEGLRAIALLPVTSILFAGPFALHQCFQLFRFKPKSAQRSLMLFKSNFWSGLLLIGSFVVWASINYSDTNSDEGPCASDHVTEGQNYFTPLTSP